MFDIVVKNGTVIDGTGSKPFSADIGISGNRISKIGRLNGDARLVIDARDLIVSPGFIDSHSHSDFNIIADPNATNVLTQGITTQIIGNCGMSGFPLNSNTTNEGKNELTHLGIDATWSDVSGYISELERRNPLINIVPLIGHGTVRTYVSGLSDRKLTSDEESRMHEIIDRSLRDGAIGVSFGLEYPPGNFADTDELVSVANIVRRHNAICTFHMRNEGKHLLDSISEVIEVAERSGVKVHISHLKSTENASYRRAKEAIDLINQARKRIRLTADVYPYIAYGTRLSYILPKWAFDGGKEKLLSRFSDDEQLRNMRDHVLDFTYNFDTGIMLSETVSEKYTSYKGKLVRDISEELGMDPFDLVVDILKEDPNTSAIYFDMCEEDLERIIGTDYVAFGTDEAVYSVDGPLGKLYPHPRAYGSFPRIMGKYVRDRRVISLEEAIRKSTSYPASIFGIKDRGVIREGMKADVVVFDRNNILDRATYLSPHQYSEGVKYVIVNGSVSFQ